MQQRGFMNVIVLIVVIVVSLAYFNVDIRSWADSHGVSAAVAAAWSAIVAFWIAYCAPAFAWALSFIN
jgi:hypothetical protein